MVYSSIVMLIGVGFFSYIMGSGIEIMTSYKEKMGQPDLSAELDFWLLTLQRFQKRPLSFSLQIQISENMLYIWKNDRLFPFRNVG